MFGNGDRRGETASVTRCSSAQNCCRLRRCCLGMPGTLARRPIVPVILQRLPHPPELLFEFRKTGIALARQRGGIDAAPAQAHLVDSLRADVGGSASQRMRVLAEAWGIAPRHRL